MNPGDCAACSTDMGICSAHQPEELLEIERLRGLVLAAEWTGTTPNGTFTACQWCGAWAPIHNANNRHRDECPAFSENGVVR